MDFNPYLENRLDMMAKSSHSEQLQHSFKRATLKRKKMEEYKSAMREKLMEYMVGK